MTPHDVIRNTIEMGHQLLTTYLSDLDDAELMVRVTPGANHPAWQLGHLVTSEHEIITAVGCPMPGLPAGFAEAYTPETSTSDDPAGIHKKAEYLAAIEEQRTGTLAALDTLSADDLDKPAPEQMREYAPTVGVAFNVIGLHTLMHATQWVPLRRKLGKPVLI